MSEGKLTIFPYFGHFQRRYSTSIPELFSSISNFFADPITERARGKTPVPGTIMQIEWTDKMTLQTCMTSVDCGEKVIPLDNFPNKLNQVKK